MEQKKRVACKYFYGFVNSFYFFFLPNLTFHIHFTSPPKKAKKKSTHIPIPKRTIFSPFFCLFDLWTSSVSFSIPNFNYQRTNYLGKTRTGKNGTPIKGGKLVKIYGFPFLCCLLLSSLFFLPCNVCPFASVYDKKVKLGKVFFV